MTAGQVRERGPRIRDVPQRGEQARVLAQVPGRERQAEDLLDVVRAPIAGRVGLLLGVDEIPAGQRGHDAARLPAARLLADFLDGHAAGQQRRREADRERHPLGELVDHVDLRPGVAAPAHPARQELADHQVIEPARRHPHQMLVADLPPEPRHRAVAVGVGLGLEPGADHPKHPRPGLDHHAPQPAPRPVPDDLPGIQQHHQRQPASDRADSRRRPPRQLTLRVGHQGVLRSGYLPRLLARDSPDGGLGHVPQSHPRAAELAGSQAREPPPDARSRPARPTRPSWPGWPRPRT